MDLTWVLSVILTLQVLQLVAQLLQLFLCYSYDGYDSAIDPAAKRD